MTIRLAWDAIGGNNGVEWASEFPVEAKTMIQTVEGIFRNGKVELLEKPENVQEARVIVTFLPMGPDGGPSFTSEELADLRGKLAAWEEDWNAPGMEAYDDYETRRRGAGPVSAQ